MTALFDILQEEDLYFGCDHLDRSQIEQRLFEIHPDTPKHSGLRFSSRIYEYILTVHAQTSLLMFQDKDIGQQYKLAKLSFGKDQFTFFRKKNDPSIELSYNDFTFYVNRGQLRFLNWVAINEIDRFIRENYDQLVDAKKQFTNKKDALVTARELSAELDRHLRIGPNPPLPPKVINRRARLMRSARVPSVPKRLKPGEPKVQAEWHLPSPGRLSFVKHLGVSLL